MIDHISQIRLQAHKNALDVLYELDSETAECQFMIGQFLLAHPKLAGLTYSAADILRMEPDRKVRAAAIKIAEEEMIKRRDVTSPAFRLNRRRLSENQIKKILQKIHFDKTPSNDLAVSPITKRASKCVHCQNCISKTSCTREEVVSFRATECTEDAISYLAQRCMVSRSYLISELLIIKNRFGDALRELKKAEKCQ
jgi:ferredoxin